MKGLLITIEQKQDYLTCTAFFFGNKARTSCGLPFLFMIGALFEKCLLFHLTRPLVNKIGESLLQKKN